MSSTVTSDGVGDACDDNPVYVVSSDAADRPDFLTIQEAIDGSAQSGSTIRILGQADAYLENVVVDHGQVFTFEGVADGSGNRAVIDGSGGTAIRILSTMGSRAMVLSHLTIRGRNGLVVGDGVTPIDTEMIDLVFEDIAGGVDSTAVELVGGTHSAEGIEMVSNVRHGFELTMAAHLDLRRSRLEGLTGTAMRLDGSALVENVLIAACDRGIDVPFADGSLDLRHSTVAECTGPAVDNNGGTVTVAHTIAWGNHAGDDLVGVTDCGTVSWSDLGDCTCDGVNDTFCLDPLFAAPDYTLADASPALDHGPDPSSYDGAPCQDLNGGPRLMDYHGDDGLATVDIGAYEHRKTLTPGPVTGLVWTGAQTLAWDAEPSATSYHVYRDDLAVLGYADFGSCDTTLDPVTTETLTDARHPAAGQGWFYLITADDDLREGTLGDGTCAERSNYSTNTCTP